MLFGKRFGLAACALFLFTTFILVIVAISGSTSNYKPLNNIYIGSADIAHINVTKIIPSLGPILSIVGGALNSPNSSVDTFFPILHKLVDTAAFVPLLTMLSNAEDTNSTVSALGGLAPLALSANSSGAATEQMQSIYQILDYSTNTSESMQGFESLVAAAMENPTSNSSEVVLELLGDSNDTLSSTDALLTLNNMSTSEKAQLVPVFALFQVSNNQTVTFGSLATLMTNPVSSSLAQTLFSTLNQSSNVTQTLQQLQSIVPEDSRPALSAVGALISSSSSPNTTLASLQTLVQNNVTSSPSAQEAFVALTALVRSGENDTLILSSVQTLAMTANATSATNQLISLKQLLESSNNQTGTLQAIGSLQEGLAADSSSAQYISPLVTLLESSSDPKTTLSSLAVFTVWAQANRETFLPVTQVLHSAQTNPAPTQEQLNEMVPLILQYFNVNTKYQLSIFTLCERNLDNKVQFCSKSHAVQNLDFRSIIWNDLIESDFTPYLNALNVTEDSLYLEGKLLRRQHEYVPAVKATLACSLISIIFAFFLLLLVLYLVVRPRTLGNKAWMAIIFACLWYTLFTCLAAVIVTAVVGIIKSGTSDDKYGVVFTAGSAYMGLIWTSFVLSLLCPVLLIIAWLNDRRERKTLQAALGKDEIAVNTSESMSSSVNNQNTIQDVEKNTSTPVVTN